MTSVVLRGGRVIEPRTGADEVRDLHVRDGRVVASEPGPGATVIDVTGCIVGPGFVDLHSHVNGILGQRLQALDGVTTSLELEAGMFSVDHAYATAALEGRPLHYGFSASWAGARGHVLAGCGNALDIGGTLELLGEPLWQASSSPRQLDTWLGLLREELAAGALGVGILQGYAPRSDPDEYLAVARVAAEAGAPTFTHVRELAEADPTTPVDGVEELVRAAGETGAHMHHCHINSTSRRHLDRVLRTIERAQAEGSRVTVEAYPYGAGSTAIGAAFLAPERLHVWDVEPSALMLVPSGEQIRDAAHLRRVRAETPGAACIVTYLDESHPADSAILDAALGFADCIVASDAMPVWLPDGTWSSSTWPPPAGASTHPRTAGTYARTLRSFVIDDPRWSWLEAFRRCSFLPARVLDDVAPDMGAKGHLDVGADADVVVLDPTQLTDTATYLDPTSPSRGVRHLLVAGEAVVRDGQVVLDAMPGRPVRG